MSLHYQDPIVGVMKMLNNRIDENIKSFKILNEKFPTDICYEIIDFLGYELEPIVHNFISDYLLRCILEGNGYMIQMSFNPLLLCRAVYINGLNPYKTNFSTPDICRIKENTEEIIRKFKLNFKEKESN